MLVIVKMDEFSEYFSNSLWTPPAPHPPKKELSFLILEENSLKKSSILQITSFPNTWKSKIVRNISVTFWFRFSLKIIIFLDFAFSQASRVWRHSLLHCWLPVYIVCSLSNVCICICCICMCMLVVFVLLVASLCCLFPPQYETWLPPTPPSLDPNSVYSQQAQYCIEEKVLQLFFGYWPKSPSPSSTPKSSTLPTCDLLWYIWKKEGKHTPLLYLARYM